MFPRERCQPKVEREPDVCFHMIYPPFFVFVVNGG
jgi:hypothetical protein